MNPMRALTETPFGPVIRALLSQIAMDPALGDRFRATVVQARRAEVARVMARGIERGDLRPDADASIATELLVGPVYFRLAVRRRRWTRTSRSGVVTASSPAPPSRPGMSTGSESRRRVSPGFSDGHRTGVGPASAATPSH